MSCPTCSETMQRVNEGTSPVTYWCPRCGTLRSTTPAERDGFTEDSKPTLVQRATTLCEAALDILADYREFQENQGLADPHLGLGLEQAERAVSECCLPPEER